MQRYTSRKSYQLLLNELPLPSFSLLQKLTDGGIDPINPFGQRSLWLAYERIPLSLSSFYIGNPNICKHKKQNTKKLKNDPCHHKTGQKK